MDSNRCSDDFEAKLKDGQLAEHIAACWLREHGWLVLPMYRTIGEAPTLLAKGEEIVAPDLVAMIWGATRWFEVKRKNQGWNWYYTEDVLQTCIDERLFKQYQAVERAGGVPVRVIMLTLPAEGKPDGLYVSRLARLEKNIHHEHAGIFYWNIDCWKRLCTYEEAMALLDKYPYMEREIVCKHCGKPLKGDK